MYKRIKKILSALPFILIISVFLITVISITITVVLGAFSHSWVGTVLPSEWTLYNIKHAWSFYEIGRYYIISLKIIVMSTFLSLVCAIPTGYILARKNFFLKGLIEKFFKLPILLPELLIGIPLASLFYSIGLAETYVGVVLVLMVIGIPFGLSILIPFLETMDSRVEIAAQSLGANKLVLLTHIIVPQLIPGITSTTINVFVRLFANYVLILLLGGPGTYTLTIKVFSTLANARSESQGLLNALTVYYMLPMLGFTSLSLVLQNTLKKRFGSK